MPTNADQPVASSAYITGIHRFSAVSGNQAVFWRQAVLRYSNIGPAKLNENKVR
jgi:hypothetical protein